MNICLKRNQGFRWEKISETYCKGYFINTTSDDLITKIEESNNVKELLDVMSTVNGCYAIITKKNNNTYIISDRLRTLPVFYAIHKEQCVISDDSIYLDELFEKKRDKSSLATYRSTRYVFDNKTINPYVFQTQACEVVEINEISMETNRYSYYRYSHDKTYLEMFEECFEEIYNLYYEVMYDAVKSCGEKTIVVPLSAGQDSRIIIAMLHKLNCKNVICFTYGKKNNFEAVESKRIAEYLGYKWFFVEIEGETWKKVFNEQEFHEYLRYAGGIHTTACIQQFYAIKVLKENGSIPVDSIIMPGHGGDVCVGEIIPSELLNNPNEDFQMEYDEFINGMAQYYYDRYYVFGKENNREKQQHIDELKRLFKRNTEDYKGKMIDISDFVDILHFMNFKEDESKYICNEVRNNEFFGFEWRLPLIDNRIMDFWSKVPYHMRSQRCFYMKFASKFVDPITNTNTNIPVEIKKRKLDKLRQTKIYRIFYYFKMLRRRYREYDENPLNFYKIYDKREFLFKLLKWGIGFNINKVVVDIQVQLLEEK